MVSSTLSQKDDLESAGFTLNLSPETEALYRKHAKTFIEDYPQLLAEANGIARKDVGGAGLNQVISSMQSEWDSALRSGPSTFLDVFTRHGRLLIQCSEMAELD